MRGMGLLPMDTVFAGDKTRTLVKGKIQMPEGDLKLLGGIDFEGYEIHMGVTTLKGSARPFTRITARTGERIEEKEALPELYTQIGEAFARLDTWSKYVITSYEKAETYIGRKADKNRKIYNGMMKTYYYQFLGPKPPRRKEDTAGKIQGRGAVIGGKPDL